MGKRGYHCSEEMRREIIRQHEHGYNAAEIARNLKVSHITVLKWIERWQAHGAEGLHAKRRDGGWHGGATMPEGIQAEIIRLAQEHPDWSYSRIARTVTPMRYPDLQRGVAASTVEKYLTRAGLARSRWGDDDDE